MFFMLYSNNWQNFIARKPLHLEILGNTCITIICLPGCDIINLEINLMTIKCQDKNLNILRSKHLRTQSKMELFAKIVEGKATFTVFGKTSTLDVWLGSEYICTSSFSGTFYILLGVVLRKDGLWGKNKWDNLGINFCKSLVKHCGTNYHLYQKKSLYNLPNLFLIKEIKWHKFMFTSHIRSKCHFC